MNTRRSTSYQSRRKRSSTTKRKLVFYTTAAETRTKSSSLDQTKQLLQKMALQASHKPLLMLANSLACNTLQSPFARIGTSAAAAATAACPCGPSSCGPYLQQLSSVQQVASLTKQLQPSSSLTSLVQQPTQTPPLQQLPPYRTLRHSPSLPPLRTQRSRNTTHRLYCTKTVAAHAAEEPIIVTVSWLGAKRGPFSKYKQLWHSLGYNRILAARPPMTSIMFPIQGQLLAANFTHKLLQKARAHPKAPILVHLFSGGGFIFMGWVFQLLAELKSPEAEAVRSRIAGVVLDSSPAMVTADVSSRALVAAALGRPAEGIEAELPWLIKPAAAIVDGYLRLPYVKDALVGMDTAWMQQAPACPKLFLYSDADVLVQPQVVEGFMQQQEKRGSRTYSYKWKDSAHVDHYRRYPQEYKQQLQQFVQRALSSWALTHQGKQQDV